MSDSGILITHDWELSAVSFMNFKRLAGEERHPSALASLAPESHGMSLTRLAFDLRFILRRSSCGLGLSDVSCN